jgi:hypothetical protein
VVDGDTLIEVPNIFPGTHLYTVDRAELETLIVTDPPVVQITGEEGEITGAFGS